MKNFSLIATLFFCNTIFAQPVLTAADFPSSYSANALKAYTNGFTNGNPGENQIWDYSGINLIPTTLSYNLIPVQQAPHNTTFINSNYCYNFLDNATNIYNFYYLTEQSFEYQGYVFSISSPIYYQNSSTFLQFPYTYNTIINDTYQSTLPDSTLDTSTRIYDAYGTLITPFGTFTNVIRQKETSSSGIFYYWIATNPYQIILSGNFNDTIIYFYQSNTLNTNQNIKDNSYSIYPNPTNGDFSIKNSNNFTNDITITVYDGIGKTIIKNQKIDTDFETISLKNFASGLYYVKISDKNNQLLHTEKIIKK